MSAHSSRRPGAGWTVQDFLQLPEPQDHRVELVRGWLVREPAPGGRHGYVCTILAAALHAFARRDGLGKTLVNTAFVLAREPDTVRVPDLAFVTAARLPRGGLPDSILHDAPDLAIEVLSPSNRAGEVRATVADYMAANGRVVWVVDPRRRTVAVHEPARAPRLLMEDAELHGGDVLPGFRLPVRELFTD